MVCPVYISSAIVANLSVISGSIVGVVIGKKLINNSKPMVLIEKKKDNIIKKNINKININKLNK